VIVLIFPWRKDLKILGNDKGAVIVNHNAIYFRNYRMYLLTAKYNFQTLF